MGGGGAGVGLTLLGPVLPACLCGLEVCRTAQNLEHRPGRQRGGGREWCGGGRTLGVRQGGRRARQPCVCLGCSSCTPSQRLRPPAVARRRQRDALTGGRLPAEASKLASERAAALPPLCTAPNPPCSGPIPRLTGRPPLPPAPSPTPSLTFILSTLCRRRSRLGAAWGPSRWAKCTTCQLPATPTCLASGKRRLKSQPAGGRRASLPTAGGNRGQPQARRTRRSQGSVPACQRGRRRRCSNAPSCTPGSLPTCLPAGLACRAYGLRFSCPHAFSRPCLLLQDVACQRGGRRPLGPNGHGLPAGEGGACGACWVCFARRPGAWIHTLTPMGRPRAGLRSSRPAAATFKQLRSLCCPVAVPLSPAHFQMAVPPLPRGRPQARGPPPRRPVLSQNRRRALLHPPTHSVPAPG